MTKIVLLSLACALFSINLALAGSQSFACLSKEKNISFAVGNEGDGQIKIKYLETNSGKTGEISAPVTVMPNYGYAGSNEENSITVIPVSDARILSSENAHMHVTHKDGTSCDGREFWDTKTSQKFVLTARDGDSLSAKLELYNKEVSGKTADGYIVINLLCRDWGATSTGGCHAEDGDKVEIIKDQK